jgi:hypothetical protein
MKQQLYETEMLTCHNGAIMHGGNVGRIRERRVKHEA